MSSESRYHVQMRSRRGLRRAWVFNLTEQRLRDEVVRPWLAGDLVVLGDFDWEPRKSELQILEGPELEGPDLAMGEGPNSANRTAENVTRRILDEATSGAPRAQAEPAASGAPATAPAGGTRVERVAAKLLEDLAALDGVSVDSEKALGLVTERLRALGLD